MPITTVHSMRSFWRWFCVREEERLCFKLCLRKLDSSSTSRLRAPFDCLVLLNKSLKDTYSHFTSKDDVDTVFRFFHTKETYGELLNSPFLHKNMQLYLNQFLSIPLQTQVILILTWMSNCKYFLAISGLTIFSMKSTSTRMLHRTAGQRMWCAPPSWILSVRYLSQHVAQNWCSQLVPTCSPSSHILISPKQMSHCG